MHTSYTVIITTFNRNLLLQRSLKSVLDQSLQPKEIIIINNHNKDIKKKFKSKKIKYYNLIKNFGSANGRNIGASLAKGKFLAYLDDDDFWHKDYLKHFVKINYDKDYDLILTNTNCIKKNQKNKIFHIDHRDFNVEKIGLYNPGIRSSATIVKRKSFLKVNGYDLKLYYGSADKDFLVKIIKNKMKIKIIKRVLVNYLLHENSHSRNSFLMLKSVIEYYKKHNHQINLINKIRYFKKIIYLYYLNLICD